MTLASFTRFICYMTHILFFICEYILSRNSLLVSISTWRARYMRTPASWLRDPAGCARVRCPWRIAVGQGLSRSSSSSPVLVFSSLKDRSSPRDPLVSHGEERPRAHLSTGAGQVYIFIDFDYGPIPRETHASRRVDSFFFFEMINRPIMRVRIDSTKSRILRYSFHATHDLQRVWCERAIHIRFRI